MEPLLKHLIDRDKTNALTNFFVSKAIEEQKKEIDSEDTQLDGFLEFYTAQRKLSAEHNIDVIYSAKESPIECAFLNSLHLCFIKSAELNVYFEQSSDDHLLFMDDFVRYYQLVEKRYLEFRKKYDNVNIEDFLYKAQQIYLETEHCQMPGIILSNLRVFLDFGGIFVHNYFHLTTQAKLPQIKHNGRGMRVDLFIWVPTHPKIRIAVECDGYRYHSSHNSFVSDRQRSRILHSHGIEVLRFSGREINNDPAQVASELFYRLGDIAEKYQLGPISGGVC